VAIQIPYTDGFITPAGGSNFESKNNKGQVNGYAPLDGDAKVPSQNLPTQNINIANYYSQISTALKVNTSSQDGTGGSIDLHGGSDTEWSTAGNAGSIDLSGGDGSTTEATANQNGGNGGSLLLSGESLTGADGGTIDCRGLNGNPGGSINTSDGGGSINTKGVGSIGLGGDSTRTILVGSANGGNKTVTIANATGALPVAVVVASTPLNFPSISAGDFSDLTVSNSAVSIGDIVIAQCLSGRGATHGKLVFETLTLAASTITIRAHNPTTASIDADSYNFKLIILKT